MYWNCMITVMLWRGNNALEQYDYSNTLERE
jgi:hypothetical protein